MADLAQPEGCAVGVDVSATMIQEARRRHGHRLDVSFQTADAGLLPFESATFDACRCERTLQHSTTRCGLGRDGTGTSPGGRLALLEPDWGTLIVSGGEPEVTKRILAVHVGRHQQPGLGRRLRGLLTTHGFTDIELGAGVVMYTDVSSAYRAFGMVRAGELAVRAGVISEQEALRWGEDLVKADDELTFLLRSRGSGPRVASPRLLRNDRPTPGRSPLGGAPDDQLTRRISESRPGPSGREVASLPSRACGRASLGKGVNRSVGRTRGAGRRTIAAAALRRCLVGCRCLGDVGAGGQRPLRLPP